MTRLNLEFEGFLKFIKRANKQLITWFGPSCQNDPTKILYMASKEWEVMDDTERRFFIRSHTLETKRLLGKNLSDANAFLGFALNRHYKNSDDLSLYNLNQPRIDAENWRNLPDKERQKYADLKLSDLGMDHVIEKRGILHQLYEPNRLNKLELLIKTKPAMPMHSRAWFFRMENMSINSKEANERWNQLTENEKRVFKGCTSLDRRRYTFEKKAWFTRLLMSDLESDEITLDNFESLKAKSNVDTIVAIMELDKTTVPAELEIRRPMSAFSLFVRAYRYQIRDEHPEFQFGDHLRKTGLAWRNLPEEVKQKYKDEAKELRANYKALLESKKQESQGRFEMPTNLFKHSKATSGPTRPQHLIDRLPSAPQIYGRDNNIRPKDRKATWDRLTDKEKEPYIKKHEELKETIQRERARLRAKMDYIKELIKESDELEQLKKNLRLLQTRNRPVRLYTRI